MRPNDELYLNSKFKKINNNYSNDLFFGLYNFIYQKHSFFPLNIEINSMLVNEFRIDIVFEYEWQVENMLDDKKLNFNSLYQKEIELFVKTEESIMKEYKIQYFDKIFVSFRSFDVTAIEESNLNISTLEIEKLINKYKNDNLYNIQRVFDSITVFYLFENDIFENLKRGISNKIKEDYLNLLKKYDTFSYVNPENFKVRYASKENLDNNYNSSLYYFHL